MRTAVISDLHLGTVTGSDLARRPRVRDALLGELTQADRVVLLGDLIELREASGSSVLELVAPFLRALGEACADKPVTIVPGNHDHALIAPALEGARLAGDGVPAPDGAFEAAPGTPAGAVKELLGRADVALAYPGTRIRDDVYATHGHYLDVHLTVPRIECVFAHAVARVTGAQRSEIASTDDYEQILSPIYALAHSLVAHKEVREHARGGNVSRAVYGRAGRGAVGFAISRIAIPAAVAAVNSAGLGPFRTDISPTELRRSGLRAMGEVIERLGIEAGHVIFGHTHRAGPLPGDIEGWTARTGTKLHNTGSWLNEEIFLGSRKDASNPYYPGWITWVGDDGPPELVNVVDQAAVDAEG